MRDYMKLLESLHICVCNRCSDTKNPECLASKEDDCKRELMAIAADAIEELLPSAQPELIKLHVDHALTEEEIKNLKQKIAASPIVLTPSAQTEQQWIPCKDRLPERTRKAYWVCTDGGHQYECRWTNNRFGLGESDNWGWSVFDIPQHSKVVAWMPLPEPYEEEEGEDE